MSPLEIREVEGPGEAEEIEEAEEANTESAMAGDENASEK